MSRQVATRTMPPAAKPGASCMHEPGPDLPMQDVSQLLSPHETGRRWVHAALEMLAQEAARSADTHLLKLDFPGFPGIDFYFKDESAHPSGSLKHRLARSRYLYALCTGRLREG